MAGKVLNIKVCSPLKLRSGLTGNYYAICHYSYNLPLCTSVKDNDTADNLLLNRQKRKMKIANAQNNTFASPDTQAAVLQMQNLHNA